MPFQGNVSRSFSEITADRHCCAWENGMTGGNGETGFITSGGDIKAVVNGHDHVNDFMVELSGIKLCYCSTISETGCCDMDMPGARVFTGKESDSSDVETCMTYVTDAAAQSSGLPKM